MNVMVRRSTLRLVLLGKDCVEDVTNSLAMIIIDNRNIKYLIIILTIIIMVCYINIVNKVVC